MNWRLLQKYLSEKCSPEEKKRIESWLNEDPENQNLMNSLTKIWGVEPKDKIKVDAKSAWNSFQHKISDERENSQAEINNENLQKRYTQYHDRQKSSRSRVLWWSVAALILVTVSIYNFMPQITAVQDEELSQQQATVQQIVTERGQRTSFRLMDGTKVQLNADSRITIPPTFGDSTRRINLEGEAYFEVAHNPDKPFTVYANNAYTRVLGTKFGVKAYTDGNEVGVVVEEGKVSVGSLSKSDSDVQPITKNKRGSISQEGKISVMEVSNISRYLGWKDGRMIFESTPLYKVVSELERWYNINIVLADKSIGSKTITASFEDEPMAEVLNIITLSIDVNYKREGRKITIHSNGQS